MHDTCFPLFEAAKAATLSVQELDEAQRVAVLQRLADSLSKEADTLLAAEAYTQYLWHEALGAAQDALAARQPARLGWAFGESFVNVCRLQDYLYSDENGYDVETYIQIFNCMGFLMQVEVENVARIIHAAKHPVMTIKPMAAGRCTPYVGLTFSWNAIRDCDMVTVGTNSAREAAEDIEISMAALEHRFPDLEARSSPFRQAVWEILLTIPRGSVTTYGEIAAHIAAQRGLEHMSAQAVGGAVGHNPVSIIVPCHRVVGADGSLTGYAGGIERKAWLLALEGWL